MTVRGSGDSGSGQRSRSLATREEIDRVKNSVDIVALAERVGIHVTRSGEPAEAFCPFHGDKKSPSLRLYRKSKLWGHGNYFCFTCKCRGDPIDLVCKLLNLNVTQAVEWITGRAVASLPSVEPKPRTLPNPERLEKMTKAYSSRLSDGMGQGKRALEYLEERSLSAMIEPYKLGVSFTDSSKFSDRLTIPYLTKGGQTALIKYRALLGEEPKYLSTPFIAPHLYLEEEAQASDKPWFFLVEGELDALSVKAILGLDTPVVASPGLATLPLLNLAPFAGRHAYLILDNDKWGELDRPSYRAFLERCNIVVSDVNLPSINEGKTDVNDLLVSYGEGGASQWLSHEISNVPLTERELV